ncbi:unnamed protein product [Rotaria sp. Silwood1]|nr:unnamed protein product [Rotaria sp. Silwood1]
MSFMQEMESNSMETQQLHSSQKEAIKKITEFLGESNETDIDEWLVDLNNLFSIMKFKDETTILETMGKLTGSALRWYQENLRSFTNWNDAEKPLRDRFKEFTSDKKVTCNHSAMEKKCLKQNSTKFVAHYRSLSTTTVAKSNVSTNERVTWFYKIENASDSSWLPFGDIEKEIIEKAFMNHEQQVQLDRCLVNLEENVRINKEDSSFRMPIKRCVGLSSDYIGLRPERFYIPQKLVKSFSDWKSNDRRFINEWQRQNRGLSMNELLEQAADGIIKEGIQLCEPIEAKWIADELLLLKNKSNEEIEKRVVSIYTRESFLYRLVNATLRENDLSKLYNLGAFCWLLFHCDCSSTFLSLGYAGKLYRGAQLDKDTIESYRQAIGLVKTWDAFSSTSKNRKKAETFGNTLFIISLAKSAKYRYSGMDISSLSLYPDEEEVLIRASRNFFVDNIEQDNVTGKYLIYLSLC